MDYQTIKQLFEDRPLFRLFRKDDPALIISFLFSVFKKTERISIPEDDAVLELALFLDETGRETDQYGRSGNGNGNGEERKQDNLDIAGRWIAEWSNERNRFLRRFRDENGIPVVELTPHVERAIRMIEDMERIEYVATESRFADILHRLRRLAAGSVVDPRQRVADLEKQKQEIEEEIRRISSGEEVVSLDPRQIHEQLFEITRSARDLIADFKAIEENFRAILSEIYREEIEHGDSKGYILSTTLDAARRLKDSSQGKSFHAFWDFLIADYGRDEISGLVNSLFNILDQRGIEVSDGFLRRLKQQLHMAGKRIVDSNRKLAERLNRIIVGPDAARSRYILSLIGEVKRLIIDNRTLLSSHGGELLVETDPELGLPMERPLSLPEEQTLFDPPQEGEPGDPDLMPLFDVFSVDYGLLADRIASLSQGRTAISLEEVLDVYPPEKGMSELLAYLDIAGKNRHALIDEQESFFQEYLFEGLRRTVRLPKVLFGAAHGT